MRRRGAIERRDAVESASAPVRGGVARNDNTVADRSRTTGETAGAADADPFAGDVDAWLGWLMDCVAIETAIRRRG